MVPPALLPISNSVQSEAPEQQDDHFLLKLATKSTDGVCPDCGTRSQYRHSRYMRKLLDLPWAGIPVKIHLSVNKYYCRNHSCSRKIFTERFVEELKPYDRRTSRLTDHLTLIGYVLGGNAGSRLASLLGMPVGRSTMLRIMCDVADDTGIATPRVLGIDDWAFRKGHTYGTILVDLEKRKPIDLLPDRKVETVSEGYSIRSIRRQTGLHQQTIKKYLKYEEYPQRVAPRYQISKALPFEDYLRKRWSEGETSHLQLWREIKDQGFTGSPASVYRFVSKYPNPAEPVP